VDPPRVQGQSAFQFRLVDSADHCLRIVWSENHSPLGGSCRRPTVFSPALDGDLERNGSYGERRELFVVRARTPNRDDDLWNNHCRSECRSVHCSGETVGSYWSRLLKCCCDGTPEFFANIYRREACFAETSIGGGTRDPWGITLNTEKIRVCILAEAGIGGTGKAATIYAAQLASRGYDVDYIATEGPRTAFLNSRGVRSLNPAKSDDDLYNYITRDRPQVIHQHVPGYPTDNRLYRVLQRVRFGERPKIVETNVFGRLEDPEGDELVDFRLFVSAASAAQSFRRARIEDPTTLLDRHAVLYNPVLPARDIEPSARRQFREHLGISNGEILAVRIGRPGHKWSSWECKAYALAKRNARQVRLFLMEAPRWLTCKIEQGKFGDGIILQRETSDFAWLEKLYASADLMTHASDWGESFGYTIAEGMAAGLPVITRSTPWGDNAQVELVKHEETGFVCWSVPEMARRLIELSESASLRRKMHAAGKERIAKLGNVENETDVLEEVIKHLLYDHSLSKVAARNQKLLGYCRDFRTFETAARKSFPHHPFEFASASIYAAYRSARSDARAIVDRLNRRQIGWSPTKRRFRAAVARYKSTFLD